MDLEEPRVRRPVPISHRIECFDAAGDLLLGTRARGRASKIETVAYRLASWIGARSFHLRRLRDDKVLDRKEVPQ